MAVARCAAPETTQEGGVLSRFLRALTAGLVFAGFAATVHSEGLAGAKGIAVTGGDQSVDPAFAARAKHLNLKSASALVVSQDNGHALYAKNIQAVVPIASITKLMTAMVTLDVQLGLDEPVTISEADIDEIKNTRSRLKVGTTAWMFFA